MITANYLQSLNWKDDSKIHQNIVHFYTKASAYDNLATFFEMCADVEIEEYANYGKACLAVSLIIQY